MVSEMSVVSDATSTTPPAAGPPAWAIGAAYIRNGRPSSSMFSNPVWPRAMASLARASNGSSRAPSVNERAIRRPWESSTSTASCRPETGLSNAPA